MNNKEIDLVIDFLTQSNYNHNRKLGVTPEKFALLYGEKKVSLMEKSFEKVLTTTQK